MRYMFGGKISLPMVVRLPCGAGVGAAAQHSQSLEAWMTHVPGLKVVYPSTPQDALGLMLSSIDDDNPVMFFEHKAVYALKGDVESFEPIPLGKGDIKREGSDVTVIATGKMVYEALAAAEKAEREYAAEAAAYAQTPAAIVEQARAAQGDTFSIYQLKPGDSTRDYRFEPLDAIRNNGLSVKPENYELVYTAPLTAKDDLESIYTRFNVDRPADFTGHSLSVSDIVVLHQDGKDTAHYCDRFGFSQVPEFLQPERAAEVTIPTPEQMATQERISTPRGSFCVTNMTREQMEAAGYGVHHQSDDGKYLIMGNGTRAFAVLAQQPEQDNPLRTAEMTLEDDYGMIDGVINNGRRGEELEKAQEYAERTTPEKPSIRERLEDAKRECAEHKPPEGKKPGRDVPEHDCL